MSDNPHIRPPHEEAIPGRQPKRERFTRTAIAVLLILALCLVAIRALVVDSEPPGRSALLMKEAGMDPTLLHVSILGRDDGVRETKALDREQAVNEALRAAVAKVENHDPADVDTAHALRRTGQVFRGGYVVEERGYNGHGVFEVVVSGRIRLDHGKRPESELPGQATPE